MGNIRIKNLSVSYDGITVFKDFNYTLRKDKTLSIIGTSGSGKTTLLRVLNGDISYKGEVYINDILVNDDNFAKLRKEIGVVFRDSEFINDVVVDELVYSLKQLDVNMEIINDKLDEINEYFNINKLLRRDINSLNRNDRTLIKILSYAISNPSYLAIDDLLIDLNYRTKLLLLNYLNSKNIILINVTSDMEDILYSDYLICLYKGMSAIDGKTLDVIKNEKLLKRLGFSLPFIYDLSLQLKLYGVINKVYLNKEELVKNIWK